MSFITSAIEFRTCVTLTVMSSRKVTQWIDSSISRRDFLEVIILEWSFWLMTLPWFGHEMKWDYFFHRSAAVQRVRRVWFSKIAMVSKFEPTRFLWHEISQTCCCFPSRKTQLLSHLKLEAWKHDIPLLVEVAAKAIAYLVFALPCPLRGLKGCCFGLMGVDKANKKRNILYSYQNIHAGCRDRIKWL